MPEIISSVPTNEMLVQQSSPEIAANQERDLLFLERVRLGGDELAICGVVDLDPGDTEGSERLIILDVGFRQKSADGKFGPYDIDGSGYKRYFDKKYVILKAPKGGTDTTDPTKTSYIEVDTGDEVPIGRGESTAVSLGLSENFKVSRKHASIRFGRGGAIHVADKGSANGTSIKGATELLGEVNGNFGYTLNVGDFVSSAGKGHQYKSAEKVEGWGHGMYSGRPIIARDTPINGGVYPVGGSKGEALVIDDKKYPEELDSVFNRVEAGLKQKSEAQTSIKGLRNFLRTRNGESILDEKDILRETFKAVSETLRYDLAATNALAQDSQKITLNEYIHNGFGVCRTQATLSAYLVERLIQNGRLQGSVSIDRNESRTVDGETGGHAWARYTDKDGVVYIIDPAQRYVGPLNETTDRNWDYRRTEDLLKELIHQ
jgi:hypothetical protein